MVSVVDDPARLEDQHPVGEGDGLVDVVRHQQHAESVLAPQVEQQRAHAQPGKRVQRAERFVEQQQFRLGRPAPAPAKPVAPDRRTASSGQASARSASPTSASALSARAETLRLRAACFGSGRMPTLVRTSRHGNSRGSWKASAGAPATARSPVWSVDSPASTRSTVDLPEPLRPMSATISPLPTRTDTSTSTWWSPYHLSTWRSSPAVRDRRVGNDGHARYLSARRSRARTMASVPIPRSA